MFSPLAKFVVRFWWLILLLWVAATVAGWKFAPTWNAVTKSGEVDFLPADAPSRRADVLFNKAFELQYSAGNIAIVLVRDAGEIEERDRAFVKNELHPAISKLAEADNSPINNILTINDEKLGFLLLSEDKKATVILIETKSAFQDARNVPLVRDVETILKTLRDEKKIPDGLEIGITGSATAGRDLDMAEAAGAKTIERWTIAIVIILLIGLYRAPLVALIPLLTVFVAVELALRILTTSTLILPFTPSRDLRVFITVIVYGAGVDYCLFLIARYHEELHEGFNPVDALEHTISRVGGAISASAGTVIGGVGMLYFASFGKIHEAGVVIPLALTVSLVGTLTFAASLLRLTGPLAFWPQKVDTSGSPPPPNIWDKIGPILMKHPGWIFLGANAILAPFAIIALMTANHQNFNPLSDLPKDMPSRVGSKLLDAHFSPGVLGPITVFVENKNVDFTDPKLVPALAAFTDAIQKRGLELGVVDVRSLSQPLGNSPAAQQRIARAGGDKDLEADIRREAQGYYVSEQDGYATHVTRLDITLKSDPLNRDGIESLNAIERALPELLPAELRGSTIYFAGSTSSLRDLSNIKRGDQERIQILVSLVVFLLLLVVLHRVVISVYLVVSVLLSYLATLGLTYIVFRALNGPEFAGLDWKVPIFLFTILVAVGEDYNIFLLTRVKEEQDDFGPREAIPHALSRTGQVITSCGLVMAGTFASLLSGSLQAMKQLGFAMSIGVLLDTLVVRPILVPTFLVLVQDIFKGRVGKFMALGHWKPDSAEQIKSHDVSGAD
jgi:RND superfamily putative drug exporter